ncbi:MAG: hypothetical protein WBW53_11135 [Terriglobales bacterium]
MPVLVSGKSSRQGAPAPILLVAVISTQLLATLIAVYGVFMAPLGWHWAIIVWGYALAWFLVNDRIKLAAYKVFSPHGEGWLGKMSWLRRHGVAATS